CDNFNTFNTLIDINNRLYLLVALPTTAENTSLTNARTAARNAINNAWTNCGARDTTPNTLNGQDQNTVLGGANWDNFNTLNTLIDNDNSWNILLGIITIAENTSVTNTR